MARYFLHLADGDDILLDPDGVYADETSVRRIALASARDCIAGDVRNGKINLGYRIDVQDAKGAVVHSLAFEDAVTITR